MDNNPTFAPTIVAGTIPILRLGRYQILGELGQGAMGVVYEARDPTLERHVALKTVKLPSNLQGAGEFRARFHAEAKSAGRLSHPNIVTIYDFGEAEDTAYIAMELLRGETLRDLLDRQRFSVRRAVRYAIQIADGLSAAHALGVIHRDIKPGNVVRLESGILKITDFGIAQLPTSNLTQAGTLLGTPRYMSPELIRGTRVDPRSDIFSLGVVLYEMLTNQVPFDGDSLSSIMYKVVNEQACDPRDSNEHVSAGLTAVLARCLAKDPAERFQSALELARVLRAISEDDPVEVPLLQTFLPRTGGLSDEVVAKRGISGFLKRVDRTLPLSQSRARRVMIDEKPESSAVVKSPEPTAAPPAGKERRSAWAVIPLICAVLAMVAIFAYTRTRMTSSAAANETPPGMVVPAATSVLAGPPPIEPATANPVLAGEAASSAATQAPAGLTPNLTGVDEKIVIGGADVKPVKKSTKKKPPDTTPAPAVAEAPPPAEAPALGAAAPAASAPAPEKKDSLQDQLKRQRDCLVSNRCDN
jgi:serine/threonine-protein kinase